MQNPLHQPTLLNSHDRKRSKTQLCYFPAHANDANDVNGEQQKSYLHHLNSVPYLLKESMRFLGQQTESWVKDPGLEKKHLLPRFVQLPSEKWVVVVILWGMALMIFGPIIWLWIIKKSIGKSDAKKPPTGELIWGGIQILFCFLSGHLLYLYTLFYGWKCAMSMVIENKVSGLELFVPCIFPFWFALFTVSCTYEAHLERITKEQSLHEKKDLPYNSFQAVDLDQIGNLFWDLRNCLSMNDGFFNMKRQFFDAMPHLHAPPESHHGPESTSNLDLGSAPSSVNHLDSRSFNSECIRHLFHIISVVVALCPMVWMMLMHRDTYCLYFQPWRGKRVEIMLGWIMLISTVSCLFRMSHRSLSFAWGIFSDFQKSCNELLILLYLSSTRKGRRSMMFVKQWRALNYILVRASEDDEDHHCLLQQVDEAQGAEIPSRKLFQDWLKRLRRKRCEFDNGEDVVMFQRDSVLEKDTFLKAANKNDFYSLDIDLFMCIRTWQRFDLTLATLRLQNLFAMGVAFVCSSLLMFHANLWHWGTITSSSLLSILAILYSALVLLGSILSIVRANDILISCTSTMLIEWKDVTIKAAASMQSSVANTAFVSRTRMAIDAHFNSLLLALDYGIQHIEKYEQPIGLFGCCFTAGGLSAALYTLLGAIATMVLQTVMRYEAQLAHVVFKQFSQELNTL